MKKYLPLLFLAVIASTQVAQSQTCLYGDCMNGFGDYVFENGDEYLGEWKNGARTGVGCYDWEWGAYYYGHFADSKLEGLGFYIDTLSSGTNDLFGYFANGEYSSSYEFPTIGCILGNCTNGVGVYEWENGDVFLGQWVNGYRTGLGRYDWADGSLYIGNLTDNLLDGYGEYYPIAGDKQIGYFEKGVFKGEGSEDDYYDDYDY